MLAEFSIIPVGTGESVSAYVSECLRIVDGSGLDYRLNPMGTVIEGEFDEVMTVISSCHKKVAGMCDRVVTTIRIDDRKGADDALHSKIDSVEEKVGKRLKK
ncbi:MAG: MTH1187 family thiamine-binding protein [Methanobacteriota archaeon]|nr:MAG: MTH1187 family thiamine-binding protein [Euryarchaeota archaeon]